MSLKDRREGTNNTNDTHAAGYREWCPRPGKTHKQLPAQQQWGRACSAQAALNQKRAPHLLEGWMDLASLLSSKSVSMWRHASGSCCSTPAAAWKPSLTLPTLHNAHVCNKENHPMSHAAHKHGQRLGYGIRHTTMVASL